MSKRNPIDIEPVLVGMPPAIKLTVKRSKKLMSSHTHRQPQPCSKKGARFVFRGQRCLVAVRVKDEIGPCEINRRVWRPNNWQRVQKDLNGEE